MNTLCHCDKSALNSLMENGTCIIYTSHGKKQSKINGKTNYMQTCVVRSTRLTLLWSFPGTYSKQNHTNYSPKRMYIQTEIVNKYAVSSNSQNARSFRVIQTIHPNIACLYSKFRTSNINNVSFSCWNIH